MKAKLLYALFNTTIFTFMLIILGGCTATTETKNDIEVRGSDLSQLEGHWEGGYSSAITKRSGSISFDLFANQSNAIGQVILEMYVPSTRSDGSSKKSKVRLLTKSSLPLVISFLEIEDGKVSGEVSPYLDLGSNRIINTTFIGTLRENQIKGTFKSNVSGSSDSYTGIWSVDRIDE
jgi:hypothetical protein